LKEEGGKEKVENESPQRKKWHHIPGMANPQIDQFTHALMWKAVPPIILASIGAILLREGLQWLERRATRFGRDRRKRGARRARRDAST
jgi:hypothetical protein